MKWKITLFITGKVDATKAYVRGIKLWLLNTLVANQGIETTLIESTKSYFNVHLICFFESPKMYYYDSLYSLYSLLQTLYK